MCDESTPSDTPATPEIEQAEAAIRSVIDSSDGYWTENCQQAAEDLGRVMDEAGWPAERKVRTLRSVGLSAQGAWDLIELTTVPLDVAPEEAEPLCPHCLASLDPLEHLCPACGGPVDAQANMDPLQSIYASGWAYRNAARGCPSRIVLIAMWLIFGPTPLLLIWTVTQSAATLASSSHTPTNGNALVAVAITFLGIGLIGGAGLFYSAILYRVTVGYLRSRQEPADD